MIKTRDIKQKLSGWDINEASLRSGSDDFEVNREGGLSELAVE